MSNLSAMVDALRARGSSDEELADATRIRLRRSLESRARTRVRAVRALVVAGIVLGATGAWALSTGRAGALWSRITSDDIEAIEAPHAISMRLDEPARAKRPKVSTRATPAITAPAIPPASPAIPVEPAQLAVPDVGWPEAPATMPEQPARAPRAKPVVKAAPIDPLYRKAHELHFHGRDHGAALAAWDAYLTAEPHGRFVLEAQYNRALVLVRLARYAEARIALEPFARGEVAVVGYRQREATALVERISKLEDARTKSVNE